MKKILFIAVLLFATVTIAYSKIKLPEIIGNNMVLQQETSVRVWGWGGANSIIKVSTSWNTEKYTTKTNEDNSWEVWIKTPKAGYTRHSLIIEERTRQTAEFDTLSNILIGEVWFCSGQSNMQMPLNGFQNQPVTGANRYILEAQDYQYIRMATIPNTKALEPQKEVRGQWKESTSENAQWFGAVAYLYALNLHKALKVPIGIINCSWGGSRLEGWLPEWKLRDYPDIDIREASDENFKEWLKPMIMYNGMLKPLQKYTIKGFLWYQGESNVGKHKTYAARMADMVSIWRQEWGLGELPFYFVEIAPYNYGKGDQAAYLREAQALAQNQIQGSVMVSTGDLLEEYEKNCIHPSNKSSVAERLAMVSLSNTYGFKGIRSRSPEIDKIELKENKAILFFKNAEDGFTPFENIEGFEVAGSDKIFYPALAYADMQTKNICISSSNVKIIEAVRFCFHNLNVVKLHNTRGLPVLSFRSDNW
ncbi:MAG: sialate O-acetylesterase [Rikenellaceae bacterium]